MQHIYLSRNSLRYKALSYTWGSDAPKAEISLNGKQFSVGANLEAALRRPRTGQPSCANLFTTISNHQSHVNESYCGPTKVSCLYLKYLLRVDAICINQEDNIERNQQVAQMSHIYSIAVEVIVWLGDESPGTLLALQMLLGLADLYDVAAIDASRLISHIIREKSYKNAWTALGNLLNRPWWPRAWILQEIILARSAVILCGRWCIDWSKASKAPACFDLCSLYIDKIQEVTTIERHFDYFTNFRGGKSHLKILRVLRFFVCRSNTPLAIEQANEWLKILLVTSKKLSHHRSQR